MVRLLHYSDIENAYDDPDRIGRLAGLIQSLKDDTTLVVGTGDNTAPGVLALTTEGEQALDFFHGVNPDAETFGNHDFDFGPDRTAELVRLSPQPWICANIEDRAGRFETGDGIAPWISLEIGNTRVGLFGVIDPDTSSMAPVGDRLTFTDPIAAAHRAVQELHAEGADHIVALSHLGPGDDDLAQAVEIDAVLGGHIHSERVDYVHDTLLTRPGAGGHTLLEITLGDSVDVTRHAVSDSLCDRSVRDALEKRWDEAGLNEVVAHAATPIEWTGSSVYEGECRIGNFVADAYRWAADADIGLQNSGGIRPGPPLKGDVTVGDLVSVVPFGGPVVVGAVTGEELRAILTEGDSARVPFGDATRWYAHLSGANIVYDHAEQILQDATIDGEPIDVDKTYTLATSRHALESDLEFPSLTPGHREETLEPQHEVLLAYAQEIGIESTVDGRITRHGSQSL